MRHWVKWILLGVVRPLVAMWLMVEGAPNVVRAIGSAAATVIRAIKDDGGDSKTLRSTTLRSKTRRQDE